MNLHKTDSYIFRSFPVVLMAAGVCFASCSHKAEDNDHAVARQLFLKSEMMISAYIDSVKTAQDSASLQKIVNNFNQKLTTLNYEFPADTDLDLTEDENDSLIRMNKHLLREIQKRDSTLLAPAKPDSVQPERSDSVAPKLK